MEASETNGSKEDVNVCLQNVLTKHFQNVLANSARIYSNKIVKKWELGRWVQDINRRNIKGTRDIQSLEKAANHLERAMSALDKIGWHGGEALVKLVQKYEDEMKNQLKTDNSTEQVILAPKVVQSKIADIHSIIRIAAKNTDPDGPPYFDFLDEGYPKGRPKNTAAQYAVEECFKIFERLSDQKARLRTNWDTHEAYGPYLNFVSDVLDTLGEEASAEATIKAMD